MDCVSIIELLKSEVLPTMGCTEPGAVALAAAYAGEALNSSTPISNITVTVNANVFKNGVAVGIPGTSENGLSIAAALGAIKKHPQDQLLVLTNISADELKIAREIIKEGRVAVEVDESQRKLWVKVRIETGADYAEAIIAEKHTNMIRLERNGDCLFTQEQASAMERQDCRRVFRQSGITISRIIKITESIPDNSLEFMLDGVDMNLLAAQAGLTKRLGLGVGSLFYEMVTKGQLSDDLINYAKILTAAAADARMSGESVPVMSSAGSGNHGITVIMPVYAVAKKIGASREILARAIAISHLVTVYIKIHTGNLSALCGCAVAAATGASAAITWLMGGTMSQIEWAMKNVIANLSGMICDGGKVGCALKLSTAATVAVESALLAQNDIVVPETNGIVDTTIEQTIRNLGQISSPGMVHTDHVILDIMLKRKNKI